METLTRQQIFENGARLMREQFEQVAKATASTGAEGPGIRARQILRKFLDAHLPRRFAVGSGLILDTKGLVSPPMDLVVYDALSCPAYAVAEGVNVFPSDSVAVAIEVQASLDREGLARSAQKIAAAKRLAKTKPVRPETSELSLETTLGVVFALESAIPLEKVNEHYAETLNRFGDHLDLVVVHDQGVVGLAAHQTGTPGWAPTLVYGFSPEAEGTHIGTYAQELGPTALDAFMRMLLSHLAFFRPRHDYPGFDWSRVGATTGRMGVRYLTSITFENDQEARKKKLEQYEQDARKSLRGGEAP